MQIALLSRAGEVRDAHIHFFSEQGVDLIQGTSISELFGKFTNTLISGFVIDVPLVLRATGLEKSFVQSLEDVFPTIRTNWNRSAEFRALFYDSNKSSDENLMEFLNKCRNFQARTLRNHRREEKTFNVLFWPVEAAEPGAERAYTLDISCGGLFVATCNPPPITSTLLVKLVELDQRPFKVVVRWKLEWGKAMRTPGFGGSFADLDDHQTQLLAATVSRSG